MSKRRSRGRSVDGILLLDKPMGVTSNEALQTVKRLFYAKKAGHTGSLDPLASGMLPICFGEATKFSQYLLEADKRYLVTAKLGIQTETGDAEGAVVKERPVGKLSKRQVEKVLEQFRGEIQQVPSMYSAIKHQGQPLYKLARQGITVERESRPVKIFTLTLLEMGDDHMDLDIHCSKGTYVRTLVEDIGEVLGCGAHVTALRRYTVGPYAEDQMVTMDTLEALRESGEFEALDTTLLPIDSMVVEWPIATISEAASFYIRQGQPVMVPYAPDKGWVRLVHKDGRFLGVGEVLDDGKIAPRRLAV